MARDRQVLLGAIEEAHDFINIDDGFSYGSICDKLPHSHLLKDNAIFNGLKHQRYIFLSHQTSNLHSMERTKVAFKSFGCLGAALYATPMYIHGQTGVMYHDNFYELVLSHQDAAARKSMGTLVISNENSHLESRTLVGMNYLMMGKCITQLSKESLVDMPELKSVELRVRGLVVSSSVAVLRDPLASPHRVIDSISRLAKNMPYFALLYYEALSQVVMLSSQDRETLELSERGELNARSFYDLLNTYNKINTTRFDATIFRPTYEELDNLLTEMNNNRIISVDERLTISRCAGNIQSMIGRLGDSNSTYQHLYGQELLGTIDTTARKTLLDLLERELEAYYAEHDIPYVINSATFKPEFGVVREQKDTKYMVDTGNNILRPLVMRLGTRG